MQSVAVAERLSPIKTPTIFASFCCFLDATGKKEKD